MSWSVTTPPTEEPVTLSEFNVTAKPLSEYAAADSTTGTLTFVRNGESRTFTVTTPTPLQYDATCPGPRRARIRSGEVRWTLPSGAYVSVVWTACGTRPERTFVAG